MFKKIRSPVVIVLLLVFVFSVFAPVAPVFADEDISGYFTDPNFKQAVWEWLENPKGSTPGVFTKQDLVNRLKLTSYSLNIEEKNISSLEGLEYFEGTGLKYLACDSNQLTQLPELPVSLEGLYCERNQLTQLPELTTGLKYLYCYSNQLTSLPELPVSLEYLYCASNQLTQLPELPVGLKYLYCGSNQLTSLPELPAGLIKSNTRFYYNFLNVWEEPLKTQSKGCDRTPQCMLTSNYQTVELKEGDTRNIYFNFGITMDGVHYSVVGCPTHVNCSLSTINTISSDVSIATIEGKIDEFGTPMWTLTAHKEGTCTITAIFNNIDAKFTRVDIPVTVNKKPNTPPTITRLGFSPFNVTQGEVYVDPGATATDTEDGDLTASIIVYNPVNTAVVGDYTVTYTVTDSGGLTDTATRTVIVSPAPVLGLNITPNPVRLNVGDTAQATAILKFTDNTTQNVTNATDWTASSPVASVDLSGVVTGLSPGECNLEGVYWYWDGSGLTAYSDTAKVIIVAPTPPEPPVVPPEPPVIPPVVPEPPVNPKKPVKPEPSNPGNSGSNLANPINKDNKVPTNNTIAEKPSTDLKDLDGKFIARLDKAKNITDAIVVAELPETQIISVGSKNQGKDLRAYYWNPDKQKWIALASYQEENAVEFIGVKEDYVAVFAVDQPSFTDLELKTDIETVINRLNGLAIIEGYPGEDKTRTFEPNKIISGEEFAAMQARVLGMIQPGQEKMYDVLPEYEPIESANWYIPYTQNLDGLIKVPEVVMKPEAINSINRLQQIIEAQSEDKFTGQLNIPKNNILTRAEASKLILSLIEGLGW